jgi:hypothetical protein
MTLHKVGFFFELDPQSHRAEVQKYPGSVQEDKSNITQYLRSGVQVGTVMVVEQDFSCDPPKTLGPVWLQSDGKWIWPHSLAYYVDKYNVALPTEFIEDMRKSRWAVPQRAIVTIDLPDEYVKM